jgi:hypothetical protein
LALAKRGMTQRDDAADFAPAQGLQGLAAPQGFLAAQGLHRAFLTAQGLHLPLAAQGLHLAFLTAQGLHLPLAAQGLHRAFLTAQGLHLAFLMAQGLHRPLAAQGLQAATWMPPGTARGSGPAAARVCLAPLPMPAQESIAPTGLEAADRLASPIPAPMAKGITVPDRSELR